MSTVPWSKVLDHVHAAFTAGYDVGVAQGRSDRLEDEDQAARHDLVCRVVGLRPDDTDAPRWAVAS